MAAELAPTVAELLPSPGERVAVVGCGTSYNMALAYARLREGAGQGVTDAMAASEVLRRDYDRYLLISRSGTTTSASRPGGGSPKHQTTEVGSSTLIGPWRSSWAG